MRDFHGKTYWLVGASEGLGAALAHKLSAAGADLVLSARNADSLRQLAFELPGNANVLPVDVTDEISVQSAASKLKELDGMVYLAGAYWPMDAKAWDTEKALAMIDVNLSGAVRVVGAVLPKFRRERNGHIVLTGSLASFRGLPASVGYSASKAGLASLAETMKIDLKGTGIKVQIAHPGFIRTRLTDKNTFSMPSLMETETAAEYMFKAMRRRRFATSFPTGFALLMRSLQFFPNVLYFRLFA